MGLLTLHALDSTSAALAGPLPPPAACHREYMYQTCRLQDVRHSNVLRLHGFQDLTGASLRPKTAWHGRLVLFEVVASWPKQPPCSSSICFAASHDQHNAITRYFRWHGAQSYHMQGRLWYHLWPPQLLHATQ